MATESPTNSPPKVSVVMPVYNGGAYLLAAIKSILRQTLTDLELIVVDDGSADGSREAVREFSLIDGRVKLLSLEHGGIVGALNEGLAAARGRYIARMDADDISLQDRLRLQVAYLDSHVDCVAVGTRTYLIDDDGDALGWEPLPLCHRSISRQLLAGSGGAIRHPTLMCRAEVLRELEGYREFAQWAEDLDLFLRLSRVGRLANLPQRLLRYRIHPGSVNHTRLAEQRRVVAEVLRLHSGARGGGARRELDAQSEASSDAGVRWVLRSLASGHAFTARKLWARCERHQRRSPLGRAAGVLLALRGATIARVFYQGHRFVRMLRRRLLPLGRRRTRSLTRGGF